MADTRLSDFQIEAEGTVSDRALSVVQIKGFLNARPKCKRYERKRD